MDKKIVPHPHRRTDATAPSRSELVVAAVLIAFFLIWTVAVSWAQEASWQRYVEAGCPRPVAAETAAYERFLTDELG